MSRLNQKDHSRKTSGFSLLELMVAMVITLVITGAMYGLIVSGQGSFRREPALSDRQQQIRVAMSRIQEDILKAGMGLGPTVQAFAELKNGLGPLGVRVLGDPTLGGGNSDHIEIRTKTSDCPSVRVDPANPRNGANYNAVDTWPACYPEPGWVLAFFPDGNAKWGWGHNQHGNNNAKFNFPPGQQPPESQMTGVQNLSCSLDLSVTGGACPPQNQGEAVYFAQMHRYYYVVDFDTDGVPSLFRSTTGGVDLATQNYAPPPNDAWQMLARGVEDMQIRYKIYQGGALVWVDNAPTILPLDPAPFDNVVREVEVTLWARTVGVNNLAGQTKAVGNGVTAVRGSLTTTISPRAAQEALQGETNPAKRWQ